MRFKGTLILLILSAGLAAFLYFYEYKGAEDRTKAKQEENVVWKVPGTDVSQLDLITPDQHIAATRTDDQHWRITAPRSLDADADELNRLANSAAEISRERVVEENAASLAPFGLDPPHVTVAVKTKDGKVREVRFGQSSPNGESTYAALQGKNQVFLVTGSVAANFNKKLDDLRSRVILGFEQFETQSLDLKNATGNVNLAKESDRWWIQGKARWAADSSAVNSLLGDIANGRLKEFFDENPDDYSSLGMDTPLVDVRLTVGKDRAIKHLVIGMEKAKLARKGQGKAKPAEKGAEEKPAAGTELYIARDESRAEMFFVDKEFVDKLLKTPDDLRDKTLAFFQRTDIDAVSVTNAKGTVDIAKPQAGGDWLVGAGKKKAKWDAVNNIFDALEKPVKGFIDTPGALSNYGLDKPVAHVVLKQGAQLRVDCIVGKEAKDGVYVQVMGEPYVKIAEKDILGKLGMGEADYLEPPPPPPPAAPAPKK